MQKITFEDIKTKIIELANKINAPENLFPTYGYSIDFAHPYIELDNFGQMHYVIVERGQELSRKTTNNLDELFYWTFDDIIFSMAVKYELENRIESQDCRRVIFAKQEELLGKLNENWRISVNGEHQRILKEVPFDDFVNIRVDFCKQLKGSGLTNEEIWKQACEKYPEPK